MCLSSDHLLASQVELVPGAEQNQGAGGEASGSTYSQIPTIHRLSKLFRLSLLRPLQQSASSSASCQPRFHWPQVCCRQSAAL